MARSLTALSVTLALIGGFLAVVPAHQATSQVRFAAFGAPLPLDPPPPGTAAENAPTAEQVSGILDRLVDPNMPYQDKVGLIQNGLTPQEGRDLDQSLAQFGADAELPYSFAVSDIQPAPDNLAGATIAITGPKVPIPEFRPIALVNQGGNWLLLHDSMMRVMQRLVENNEVLTGHRGSGHFVPPGQIFSPPVVPIVVP